MRLCLAVEAALVEAVRVLPPDVEAALRRAQEREDGEYAKLALSHILEDIDIARSSPLPLCQDCGLFLVLVSLGRGCPMPVAEIEREVLEGCRRAVEKASYRRSAVSDPVYWRTNTGDNLPPVIHWELVDGDGLMVDILLKGFGSENCGGVRMLRPTEGEDGVVSAVVDMVRQAGGKPCPPMFLGIGLGGTMDRAALLSKKALVREVGRPNAQERYARLEERILEEVDRLGIGAGGLGGCNTCLSVAIETAPTHIAGLPLALSISCWADRKAHIEWREEWSH